MSSEQNGTSFSVVYDAFLSRITDDMYMELNEIDTYRLLQDLLIAAIPKFEFPRVNLDYELAAETGFSTYKGVESDNVWVPLILYSDGTFVNQLSTEEVGIIATYMIVEWLGQQLASIELVRQKYSSDDFQFTSQSNHMSKVLALKKDYEREGFHLQRLYKRRRRNDEGIYETTMDELMSASFTTSRNKR